jgi:hypothetical protein
MKRLCLVASAALASACPSALADDFSSLSASFGVTTVLSGIPHATTNNPDGTAINFWSPSQEGALPNDLPHLPSDLSAQPSGDSRILLQWSGLFSRASRVQRSWSLSSPDWQTIGAVPGMTQRIPSSFTDPISPDHPRAFYRLAPSL